MIREDILQKFPDLFGTKKVNGRQVNTEQTIATLTRELGPDIASALTARRTGTGRMTDPTKSEILCYCKLFDRYIELGVNGDFEHRDREFKDRKSAAAIFGRSPNGLDPMIDDGRVACIRVGVTLLIHIPTSAALLRHRKRWDRCPSCPPTCPPL